MLKVKRRDTFIETLRELNATEELADLIDEKILIFRKNPQDTRLENHRLARYMEGKWAFSIPDDIRIVYEWVDEHTARFIAIGPHTTVYKKYKIS